MHVRHSSRLILCLLVHLTPVKISWSGGDRHREVLMGRLTPFYWKLTSVVVGSVIYFVIRAAALRMGMDANDMKLPSLSL